MGFPFVFNMQAFLLLCFARHVTFAFLLFRMKCLLEFVCKILTIKNYQCFTCPCNVCKIFKRPSISRCDDGWSCFLIYLVWVSRPGKFYLIQIQKTKNGAGFPSKKLSVFCCEADQRQECLDPINLYETETVGQVCDHCNIVTFEVGSSTLLLFQRVFSDSSSGCGCCYSVLDNVFLLCGSLNRGRSSPKLKGGQFVEEKPKTYCDRLF